MLLATLLLILQSTFSQITYPRKTGDNTIEITNQQAIEINKAFIRLDECKEKQLLLGKYIFKKDSIIALQDLQIKALTELDVSNQKEKETYKSLVKLKESQIETNRKVYEQNISSLKKANLKKSIIIPCVTIPISIGIGVILGIFLTH